MPRAPYTPSSRKTMSVIATDEFLRVLPDDIERVGASASIVLQPAIRYATNGDAGHNDRRPIDGAVCVVAS